MGYIQYNKGLKRRFLYSFIFILTIDKSKGYYNEALEEFESALEVRKKLTVAIDIATTHRFLGETICKLGNDFERAKSELKMYYSITLKLKDLVEIQRAHTTLGNYYMALIDQKDYKG